MSILRCGTAKASQGKKSRGFLAVSRKGKKLSLPVAVINGANNGPKMIFITNQHGRETVGVELLRRFYENINPQKLSGSIYCVLSCNPNAALKGQDCEPEYPGEKNGEDYQSKNNLNFCWTLNKDGRFAELVTTAIWENAIIADNIMPALVIDFHCHSNPTAVYAEDSLALDIGIISGLRNVIHTRAADAVASGQHHQPGNSQLCRDHKIPATIIEMDITTDYIKNEVVNEGLTAINNILKFYGNLKGKPVYPETSLLMDAWYSHFVKTKKPVPESYMDVKAKKPGICVVNKDKYQKVKKGDIIVDVVDPRTGNLVQRGVAGMNGVVYKLTTGRYCEKGDLLFAVAKCCEVETSSYAKKFRSRILKGFK